MIHLKPKLLQIEKKEKYDENMINNDKKYD